MMANLKNALRDKHVSLKAYANFLGISEKALQNKMNEVTAFTYPEFKQTCSELLPEYNADYLFASDETEEREVV